MPGERDQSQSQPLNRFQQRDDFFGVAAVGHGQHHVIAHQHAQIAMNRLGRMQKNRRCPRAGKCRGDFPSDQPRFPHADHDHAALAGQQQFDGSLKARIQTLQQSVERLGLDAQNAARGIETHCTLHPRTRAAICVSFPSRREIRQAAKHWFRRKALSRDFHELPGKSRRRPSRSRARQRLDEFRLPSARFPRSARQLHRMRDVKNHRTSRLAQNGKRAHIHDQILVAERCAALGENQASFPVLVTFSTALAISHGERNCPFFKFTTRPVFPAATNKSVCRERNAGNLQHVGDFRRRPRPETAS